MKRGFVLLAFAIWGLGGAGCNEDVPSPSLVEDLRVLAIRAEPPELLFDRTDGVADPEARPPVPVSFQALVVDPRGLPMLYDWSFCPVESSQTCGDFDRRKAEASPSVHPVLDAARAQGRHGEVGPPDGATGAAEVAAFTVGVSADLFDFHLASSGLGLGNGAWVSAVLALGAGSERLTSQKRLVLNARDLSAWNPELSRVGWQICPPAPAVAPAGCLPLAPRTPNRNPAIAAVEVARSALAGAPFEPLAGPLALAPGQTVRLRPVLAPDTAERYQVLESSLQDNTLMVVERTEEPIVSWFATAGEFGDEQTAPQLSKTLDNTFTAPAAPPPTGGRASIYIVVRDQRGGTGWSKVEVTVAP